MALIGHNTDFIANKPVASLFDDFEMNIKNRKFKQDFKVKPFPILQTKYKAHIAKPFKEKHLDIDDNLDVKKFKTIQDKDGNYFLEQYGILNKKNIKIEELPKVPAPDIRLNNLRKELGMNINSVNNPEDFYLLYEEYSKRADKDYKEKEDAIKRNPNIKDKESKIKTLQENKKKILTNIGIKPVIPKSDIQNTVKDTSFDFDASKEETKTKKTIKIDKKDEDHKPPSSKHKGKEMSVNTEIMESKTDVKTNEDFKTSIEEMEEKKQKELKKLEEEHKKQLQDIMNKFKKEAKETIKSLEDKGINTDPIEEVVKEIVKTSEDKSIDTQEFNKYLTEKSEEVFKKIKTKFEKEKEKDLEERRKFVKKLKEEQEKEDKDKEVKETIDDMIDKIEKEAKETKTTESSTDYEINIMQALNDGYKPKGNVSNKDYIHEMYQAENKFKHIIEKLKPHGDIERSNLNKESNEYFYQEIMPLLQKFNIDKEKLYNLFNKKPNHNLQYRNLTTLNNAIKKFLNEKLESLEKLDK